jgi:6-phosphogluconolactonase
VNNNLEFKKKIFSTPVGLAEAFSEELVTRIKVTGNNNENFTLVLSGGNTPDLMFSVLADHFAASIDWRYVHLFWGDERCVSPEDRESNYRTVLQNLIRKIDIPDINIHRIRGEQNPALEVLRYSKEVAEFTRSRNGLPVFDLVLLGIGEDGHIASIFPDNPDSFQSDQICEVVRHPATSQKRITLTGQVINNSDSIIFLVTGRKKAKIVSEVLNKKDISVNYPAFKVLPEYGYTEWFLDKEAASLLK